MGYILRNSATIGIFTYIGDFMSKILICEQSFINSCNDF